MKVNQPPLSFTAVDPKALWAIIVHSQGLKNLSFLSNKVIVILQERGHLQSSIITFLSIRTFVYTRAQIVKVLSPKPSSKVRTSPIRRESGTNRSEGMIVCDLYASIKSRSKRSANSNDEPITMTRRTKTTTTMIPGGHPCSSKLWW